MIRKNVLNRLKSKTYWLAIVTAGIGILEANIGLLRDNLGEHYGYAFVAVAVLSMAVREATYGPVGDK
jgi:hypothetical protein